MKKNIFLWAALTLTLIFSFLYFDSFTRTDAKNMSLTVENEMENGWEIFDVKNGKKVAITASQAIENTETVFLQREITESWLPYNRVMIDTRRAMLVYVDQSLVFANHSTQQSKMGELPLLQSPQNQPFYVVFALNPEWQGKTVTVVTRLYENKACASIGFEVVSDEVFLLQHEAWVNKKALPGAMFGALFLLLIGLFLFQVITEKKGFSLLFLAFSSLLQMFFYMGDLHGNPLPIVDSGVATAVCFLFPLLYIGTNLTTFRKAYFIAIASVWSVYFTIFTALYVLHFPLPYWMDKVDVLVFILLGIMLYYCIKERKINPISRSFLALLGMLFVGFILLFFVAAALNMSISRTIIIIGKEALALYCRPLLFLIFNGILCALFAIAVWDFLQKRIEAVKRMEQMKSEQNLLNLQIETAKEHLRSLRATNEQTRIYRHDMRHHFAFISGCMNEGSAAKLRNYLVSVQGDLDTLTSQQICENETANLVLSSFVEKARRAGVSLSMHAELPQPMALPDTELCAVLSNGLENAIAAASLVDSGAKAVRFSAKMDGNKLLIFIKNTYRDAVVIENGLPKTKREGHGFGTKSMKAIADKRNGYFVCEAQNGTFTLRMVLQLG